MLKALEVPQTWYVAVAGEALPILGCWHARLVFRLPQCTLNAVVATAMV